MKMRLRLSPIFALLACLAGARAVEIGDLAPHAAGLWLVEVIEHEKYDHTAFDADAGINVKLRGIRGSGQFRDEINVITAFGGAFPRGVQPKLPTFIKPDTLRVGRTYWIAFGSIHQMEAGDCEQWVIAFWPKGKAGIEPVLEKAVRDNVLAWQPQYDPESGFSYGRRAGEAAGGKSWRVRVERAGRVLWEKKLQGRMSPDPAAWVLDAHARQRYPEVAPESGKVLRAATERRLTEDNEYDLPAGPVWVYTVYDPHTGARLDERVINPDAPEPPLLWRQFDPKSGKAVKEKRK